MKVVWTDSKYIGLIQDNKVHELYWSGRGLLRQIVDLDMIHQAFIMDATDNMLHEAIAGIFSED